MDSHDSPAPLLPQDPPHQPQEPMLNKYFMPPLGESSPQPHVCVCSWTILCFSHTNIAHRSSFIQDNLPSMRFFLLAKPLKFYQKYDLLMSKSKSSKSHPQHLKYNDQRKVKKALLQSKSIYIASSCHLQPAHIHIQVLCLTLQCFC